MARGRPRQNTTLWSSRKRKARRIRERLGIGGEYVEANGRVWRYRADLVGSDRPPFVQVGEAIWVNLDEALDAET